ncbi:malonyl-ACP O-methyltransferase BioC [Helicobacter sp. MIT 21-1697]|uniref:malonyl-ACP O-methyltransferase BioC n=1 Tax=Helicobacter sp. MIT 21-1697 TaxID=2993733 RepID=UPI00224A4E1C|nr:malonyl-ACP O-methyltransferase BioC [Helicobacter sp. MIT 21-1697]MCX2717102.1 malonyl-ACP O-methyltransferase BioC [Helicobacter sp. MIT 21-1697]
MKKLEDTSLDFNLISFHKARYTYNQNSPIQHTMRLHLLDLLKKHTNRKSFDSIFEFGAGMGELTALVSKSFDFQHYITNDLYPYDISAALHNERISHLAFNMAQLPAHPLSKNQFELIISNACLQWLDCASILTALKSMIAYGGILALSSFGQNNMHEIREITGVGLQYESLETIRALLEKDFEILALESTYHHLHFDSALEVFRHLKLSGVNAFGINKPFVLTKTMLKNYTQKFNNTLTYEPLYILALKH